MVEETLPTRFIFRGNSISTDLLVPLVSHFSQYSSGFIGGIGLDLSIDGRYVTVFDPLAHGARLIEAALLSELPAMLQLEFGSNGQKPWERVINGYKLASTDEGDYRTNTRVRRLLDDPNRDGETVVGLTVKGFEHFTLAIIEHLLLTTEQNGVFPNYLRPFLGRGDMTEEKFGAGIGVASQANAWRFFILGIRWPKNYLGVGTDTNGMAVYVPPKIRIPENESSSLSCLKGTYGYAPIRTKAKDIAKALGFGDALMLTESGIVAELTGANIAFVTKEGELVIPADGPHILPGITMYTFEQLARKLLDMGELPGVTKISRRHATLAEVFDAVELLCTGTAAKVTPIVSVSVIPEMAPELAVERQNITKRFGENEIKLVQFQIGDGRPGPITKIMQAAHFYAVRGEPFQVGEDREKILDFSVRVRRLSIPDRQIRLVHDTIGHKPNQPYCNRIRKVA